MKEMKTTKGAFPEIPFILKLAAIVLPLASLLEYAVEHIIYLLGEGVSNKSIPMPEGVSAEQVIGHVMLVLEYVVDVAEVLIPTAALALMLLAFISGGIKGAGAILLASTVSRLLYLYPHYYMEHIAARYDTPESLGYAAIYSLIVMLLHAAEIALVFPVALLPAIVSAKRSRRTPDLVMRESLERPAYIDVSSPYVAFAGISALYQFLKIFVYTTVKVGTELTYTGGVMSSDSVVGYVFEYTFALLLLVGAHFNFALIRKAVFAINNKLLAKSEAKGEENAD